MRLKRLILSVILLCGIGITWLQAQEAIPVTIGEASGNGGTVSYTIGQVIYQSKTGTSGTVSEGVQQPFEISMVNGLEETNSINLSVSAYPNPSIDYLQLKCESKELKDLCFQLYDINGRILQSKKITSNQTNISLSNLVPASYFVKILRGSEEIKTFIIIKN